MSDSKKRQVEAEARTMGNGSTERDTEVADVTEKIECKGKMVQVRIEDVIVLQSGSFNLFCGSSTQKVVEVRGDHEIKFDIKSRHQKVYCLQQK
jgi:hypothetical protein